MHNRWLSVAAVVALLAAVGSGVLLSAAPRTSPALATALASMPAETLTASVTHWERVRALVGESDGGGTDGSGRAGDGAGSGAGTAAAILDRAYETDLSAVSALGDMAPVMAQRYGWSVLDASWEGLAQSRRGAAIVVQLPPEFDLGVVREGLGEVGYAEPFESDGVWRAGTDQVARIDSSLTPLMAYAVVLEDSHRVVFSDHASYAARTAGVIQGSAESLLQSEPVAAVADRLDGAVAAAVHAGGRGCQVMGFGRASRGDRAAAQQRVAAVGGVRPFDAIGLALMAGPGDSARRPPLVAAMHFPDASALAGEASRRARLAVGEAPGQGGTYGSRFAVESAAQRGGDVVLRLRPREADAQLLSDLGSGELLFATCG